MTFKSAALRMLLNERFVSIIRRNNSIPKMNSYNVVYYIPVDSDGTFILDESKKYSNL